MAPAGNRLIDSLGKRDRARLLAACEPVPLVLSEVLCEAGQTAAHVYFPTESFVSLVAGTDSHPGVEVGMIGNEGMLGAQLAQGVDTSPLHAVVQGAGTALRLPAAAFVAELAHSAALQKQVHRYLYVLMAQLTSSAACLRFHHIGPRLARWLLMSQDRAHADDFHVTHEFLAYMLGVRRVGITTAAVALQRSGLIAYKRGDIAVLDRKGLEAQACSCYARDRETYRAIFS